MCAADLISREALLTAWEPELLQIPGLAGEGLFPDIFLPTGADRDHEASWGIFPENTDLVFEHLLSGPSCLLEVPSLKPVTLGNGKERTQTFRPQHTPLPTPGPNSNWPGRKLHSVFIWAFKVWRRK